MISPNLNVFMMMAQPVARFWTEFGQWTGWLALVLTPIGILACVFYFFLSKPLRRMLQTNAFIDVVETCVQRGKGVEKAVLDIARNRDLTMGIGYHVLAGHLERGCGLVESLEKTRGFLAPQALAALKVGLEMGDPAKVLPSCRASLRDGLSTSRASLHYLLLIAVLVNPCIWAAIQFALFKAAPVFFDINRMYSPAINPSMESWFCWMTIAGVVHLALVLVLFSVPGILFDGYGFLDWLQAGWSRARGRTGLLLPWRKARVLRDFASMLAVLLDNQVQESRALALAAESTGNHAFVQQVRGIVLRLAGGESLMEAIEPLDASGELRWRLDNARHGSDGFAAALKGWQETLDARAFEREQAAAQALSTALLIVNGLALGTIAAGIFSMLNSTPDWLLN
jgi:type II secretory pathway component PulF